MKSVFNVDKDKYIVCEDGDGEFASDGDGEFASDDDWLKMCGRALCSGEVGFKIWHLCYLLVLA